MSNDTNTPVIACPSCGTSDALVTIGNAIGISFLQPDGEFTGETDFDFESGETITKVRCENCEWEATARSDAEVREILKVAPSTPPLKVTYWGGLDKRFQA